MCKSWALSRLRSKGAFIGCEAGIANALQPDLSSREEIPEVGRWLGYEEEMKGKMKLLPGKGGDMTFRDKLQVQTRHEVMLGIIYPDQAGLAKISSQGSLLVSSNFPLHIKQHMHSL
jgi:hypothetical protein